jgi:hypothetical protein
MKYHNHVYLVVGKAEVDIEVNDESEAMEIQARHRALELAKSGQLEFGESDCKHIVFSFPSFPMETNDVEQDDRGLEKCQA